MIIRNDKGTQDNSEVFFTVALRFLLKLFYHVKMLVHRFVNRTLNTFIITEVVINLV